MAEYLAGRGTWAVLIMGTDPGDATGAAARSAAAEIAACLREQCGVAGEHISTVVIQREHDRETVVQAVGREAGLAFGPLLIWYAGPAWPDADGRLCLGPRLAVPFADIDTVLAARRRGWPTLAILDCPHHGQVRLSDPEWGLLTSAAPGPAGPPPAPGLTSHVLRVLREGIPGGPPEVTLEAAYRHVAQAMAHDGQIPYLLGGQGICALVLAPNPATAPRPVTGTAGGGRGTLRPRQRRVRLAAGPTAFALGAAALAIALIVALLYPRGNSPEVGPAAPPTRTQGQAGTPAAAQGPHLVTTLTDPGIVGQVAFSPDGKILATVSYGAVHTPGTVRLWDLASGKNVVTIASRSTSIAWSPDSRTLVTSADGLFGRAGIRLWNAATGKVSAQFSFPSSEDGRQIAISPDGRTLATVVGQGPTGNTFCSGTCSILLLSLPSGTLRATLITDLTDIPTLAFSHDGTMLAAAGIDTTDSLYVGAPVSLWNLATDRLVTTFHSAAHSGSIPDQFVRADSVAFSPDDRTIAVASAEYSAAAPYTGVRLWDAASGTAATLTATGGGALAYSPDGNMLATANADGTNIQLWNTATRRLITTITLPSSPTGTVPFNGSGTLAFSPDGKTLAIPTGNTIEVWSTKDL